MSLKVKSINIHAFRGISDLKLELGGKSVLLRGENGTGKSSIVDAIEFFFTEKISHLEGVRGLSLQRHAPHVNFTSDDVNVELNFNPGNISLNRTFSSAPSIPNQLKDYFWITQKGTFILRRSQMLEFIISQPADRFRAIGNIIGIGPLDNVEREMMRLRDELGGKVASKEGEINRLIRDISDVIEKDISGIKDVIPALNEILQKANLPLITSFEDVDRHAEEMLRTVKNNEGTDKIAALNEILNITNIPFISQEVVGELNDINEKIKCLLQDQVKAELSVVDLLETGSRVIEQEKMDICPLCKQKISRELLLTKIGDRLKILRGLSNKASEIGKISVPVIDNLRGTSDKLRSVISKLESFTELYEEKEKLLGKLDSLNIFINEVDSAKNLENEIPIQNFCQQQNEINYIIDALSTKCKQLLDGIGITDEEKEVLEVFRLIEQTRSKAKDVSRINSELKEYQKYHELSEMIYDAFSETKKAKIQEVYTIIQGDIQRFYSMFHPNEPHQNIELTVALGRRASTEMRIESFGGKGEDPRAFTSEGHLDSLGLCIFLAFVKKFNGGCSLVVLDDVVNTIDANHRNKIAELLLKEFKDYQLVITTHDGIWYDQLFNFQRALNVQGNFVNMEITHWDVSTGPRIHPYKPKWERIIDKLENNDKIGAGNGCRIYLEWLLKEVCEQLNAHITFKRSGLYNIMELFDSIEKRIKNKLKDGDLRRELLSKLETLRATTFMGNMLSHDNLEIENLSIKEVRDFCEAVHNLHDAFICPVCRTFLKYFSDSKIVRCSDLRCDNPKKGETS